VPWTGRQRRALRRRRLRAGPLDQTNMHRLERVIDPGRHARLAVPSRSGDAAFDKGTLVNDIEPFARLRG